RHSRRRARVDEAFGTAARGGPRGIPRGLFRAGSGAAPEDERGGRTSYFTQKPEIPGRLVPDGAAVRTEELIRALAADAARPPAPINRYLVMALVGGVALSVLLFLITLHARPDVAAGDWTPAFCFKLIVTLALAATSAALLSDVARPMPGLR